MTPRFHDKTFFTLAGLPALGSISTGVAEAAVLK